VLLQIDKLQVEKAANKFTDYRLIMENLYPLLIRI
jgi:hypothetical protein